MIVPHCFSTAKQLDNRRPAICHIITTLETGGAQMMLYKILSVADRNKFTHSVISLGGEEDVAGRIRALGVPVRCFGLARSGRNVASGLFALTRFLRRSRPSIVQTWMHHADLFGGLAARAAGIRRIVWGIRHSSLDPQVTKTRTIFIARTCAFLSSSVPRMILCCSDASRSTHQALHYSAQKMVVIPNGFDLDAFAPSREARADVPSGTPPLERCLADWIVRQVSPYEGPPHIPKSGCESCFRVAWRALRSLR